VAKRIAFVHDLPLGGAFIAMVHFIKGLSQLGYDIDLYTLPDSNTKPFTKFVGHTYHFGIPQPTKDYRSPLHRLSRDFYTLIKEPQIEKRLAEDIDARKYDSVLVSHFRFLDAPYILRYLQTPTVYYTHGGPRTYYEYELRVPENLPFYKYYYEAILRNIKAKADRQNAREATVVATTSAFAASTIALWYGIDPQTTGLGVDAQFFTPLSTPKKHQLLIVGNPEPQKAIDLAIHALGRLSRPPKLVIASPRQPPTHFLQTLADKNRVTLVWKTGQNKTQMRLLYRQSLATLALSYREHFGFSVVESLACATPVIAVGEGAFPELVQDNRTGFLVDRSSSSVADAIEHIVTDPKLAAKLGKSGRHWVRTHLPWSDAISRLDQIIQRL